MQAWTNWPKARPADEIPRQQKPGQARSNLDLTDELHNKELVDSAPARIRQHIRYREMVEALIAELTRKSNLAEDQKRRRRLGGRGRRIGRSVEQDASPYHRRPVAHVYNNRKARFIQFIRHIFGIEILTSFPDTVAKPLIISCQHTNLNSAAGVPEPAEGFHYREGESRKARSDSIALHHHSSPGDSRRIQPGRNQGDPAAHGAIGRMRYRKTTDEDFP